MTPVNDLEKLVSDRLIAILHDGGRLPDVQKITPESKVEIKTPLIQVQVETAAPVPGFDGSNAASGVFTVLGMLTVVASREDMQEGKLLELAGVVRDLLLEEIRDGFPMLNHVYPDGRVLKVWNMGMDPVARGTDSEQGVDYRSFNLTLIAAVIEPDGD